MGRFSSPQPEVPMKEKLSKRQELAAGYVARGWSQQKIAQELGITARTVQRWLHDPLFNARVEEEAGALKLPDQAEATKELFPDAINALRELLWSESAIARLGAAKIILQSLGVSHRVTLEETQDEMIWDRAVAMLAELFNRDEKLRLAALDGLARIKNKDYGGEMNVIDEQ
jgi:transcriptional regulator with XRE-family HTH domain